jgi:hypothetical protein
VEAGSLDPTKDLVEQLNAGNPARRLGTGRKDATEVAEARRTQQRIGDGVEQDVAIGVTVKRRRPFDDQAAEGKAGPGSEGVAV